MEGFIHNLNTMHSRGGNQVVFSSINYGTDTSAEGRMVIEELLKATIEMCIRDRFYVTLRSSGALIPKDVKEGLIKGARVRFRPGKEIKNALKTLEYSKYKPENSDGDKSDPCLLYTSRCV